MLTLRSQLREANEHIKIQQFEAATLRKQLRHENEIAESRALDAMVETEPMHVEAEKTGDEEDLEKGKELTSPITNGRKSIFGRKKKKTSAVTNTPIELLNAKSEIRLLREQLDETLKKNEHLKKCLSEEQVCVQDLTSKLRDLLLENEEGRARPPPPLPPRD